MTDRNHVDYQQLFQGLPSPCLILQAGEPFTIVDANRSFLSSTRMERDQLIGRGLFDVFFKEPAGPAIAVGASLRVSLERVMGTRAADSLGLVLQRLGGEVRIARDGQQALAMLDTYAPSVVLLDIGMPEMDGYEVARAIRARFPGRRPVIVALTGWGQEKDILAARAAGFDHHLVKPVEINALQRLLVSLVD